ncbi:MAG: hypothetical protein ACJAT7_001729 [Psychromonas sp.]|jgi:hypothetical protein|uniref:hypothetical protein n=1 Tax=Psychromonas sp. TaxID=1884585 RepID=UPI0039E42C3B
MTIMGHPTAKNPVRYRVQDKIFGVQEYFSASKFGGLGKAKIAAEKRQAELDRKRAIRNRRLDLDINKIFYGDGAVVGLRRTFKKRGDKTVEIFAIQIGVDGKQVNTQVTITNRTFQQAYKLAQDKIFELRCIERCYEITKMFDDCAYLYKVTIKR